MDRRPLDTKSCFYPLHPNYCSQATEEEVHIACAMFVENTFFPRMYKGKLVYNVGKYLCLSINHYCTKSLPLNVQKYTNAINS